MARRHADRPVRDLAARSARPPSTFVRIDGMDVHLRDNGPRDALPLVLVHGTGNSLRTWDALTQRLVAAGHRVVSFDRPGFGLTGPNPTGDYRIDDDVAFVGRFLDRLRIDRCRLGRKFGGRPRRVALRARRTGSRRTAGADRFRRLPALDATSARHSDRHVARRLVRIAPAAQIAGRRKRWRHVWRSGESDGRRRRPHV